jgi:FKBP-type peptidyl-prolyl cis-trans isomerase SlyD
MQIKKRTRVTLDYKLTGSDGSLIGSSEQGKPLVYTHGIGGLLPRLEAALEGKAVGERLQLTLAPEDAFGAHDDSKVHFVSRDLFDPDESLEVGMSVKARGTEGEEFPAVIAQIEKDGVTLDANHPLAGLTLDFDLTVREVRAATPEELQEGSDALAERAARWSRR